MFSYSLWSSQSYSEQRLSPRPRHGSSLARRLFFMASLVLTASCDPTALEPNAAEHQALSAQPALKLVGPSRKAPPTAFPTAAWRNRTPQTSMAALDPAQLPALVEDGLGGLMPPRRPLAIEIKGHVPIGAQDPMLRVGERVFRDYSFPVPGVIRFVVADASMVPDNAEVGLTYGTHTRGSDQSGMILRAEAQP